MISTLLVVLFGVFLLGGVTGFLGVFPFLRQQSLLADALSHAMLPGIALAFLLSKSCHTILLINGALVMGGITALLFIGLGQHTRLKRDALLGILLSSFFGLGIVLITVIQKKAYARSAIIQKFFFGNASTITYADIWMIIITSLLCISGIVFLWKEITMFLFDSDYAYSLGYPVVWIERMLMGIFVITLALGLHVVGVVLMSSFLIAPAAAARQWVSSVFWLCLLATIIGSLSGTAGVLVSYYYGSLPTGPTIVLCLTSAVLCSLLLSPSRGIIRHWFYDL